MIRYYKTINQNLERLDEFEPSCWINLTEPTSNEIEDVSKLLEIEADVVGAALDNEESSRVEYDDDYTLILIDIPFDMSDAQSSNYMTVPIGIILAKDCIITICSKQTRIINDFIVGHVKDFYTYMKTRFILQILYRNATFYLLYLRRINNTTNLIEQEIHNSMKNRELLQLLQLEKSLVYFSTSLTANEATLDRLLKLNIIKHYQEDQDLLEDVIIENKQALQMSNVRASGSDDAIKLSPPKIFTLEESLEFIEDDELVEVTPDSIRLRKKILNEQDRIKYNRSLQNKVID